MPTDRIPRGLKRSSAAVRRTLACLLQANRVNGAMKLAGLAVLVLLLPGCAWTVRPPVAVSDPVPVWVSQYGRHARVAVPSPDETKFIEYGFGEWNFYGREQRGFFSSLRAITGLGAGAFSRRELSPAPDGTLGPAQTGGLRSESLWVERAQADALRAKLDARWEGNQHTVRTRGHDGIVVSRDPARYNLFNNSNHASARWLEELGCEVRGLPVQANFRLSD
jgi:hypothetical protein